MLCKYRYSFATAETNNFAPSKSAATALALKPSDKVKSSGLYQCDVDEFKSMLKYLRNFDVLSIWVYLQNGESYRWKKSTGWRKMRWKNLYNLL